MTMSRARTWSVAEAKANLSRVVAAARSAPQTISKRGRDMVVVVDATVFAQAQRERESVQPGAQWREFLKASARLRAAGGATLARSRRTPRKSPLGNRDG